ncbi:tol-pal system protein YbgF [Roseospira navarrensis]|uniref:Cell division coordinator CpoB n=1 Tax=Roseospira navarrensis TaxID=140058 RepID=A0A7X1ZDC0_9PROT|nr:tol-pal system protein YbgF [Roseospira navarrensis]MQX36455.1 tol-pal system protein YbgF [Roseospira navarrensis]
MPSASLPACARRSVRRSARPLAVAVLTGRLLVATALALLPLQAAHAQDNRALIADMQVRITQLEDLVRNLTGSLEETQFRNRQLQQRLDLIERELDMRLGALEGGGTASSASGSGAEAAPSPSGDGGGSALAPDEGVLGYTRTPAPSSSRPSSGGFAGSPANILPPGSPEVQYNHAFSLLRQRDYGRAEQAFKAFVEANGTHTLAGNAQYWLGETHYAREDYESAAVAFAKGYKEFPDSSKTPDNLFKLGMSMSALGKKREACAAFQKLRADFPNVAGTLQRQVSDQMARNGC